MSDQVFQLLDLPASARLIAADGEIQVLTITHEHADKVSIERKRLGSSIDLADLLGIIGMHGLSEPKVQITEIPQAALPAPVEQAVTAPVDDKVACPECGALFHQRGLGPHMATHKPTPEPTIEMQELNLPQHPCPHCERTFYKQEVLGRHIDRVHRQVERLQPVEPVEYFPCGECDQTFEKQKSLNIHVGKVHKDPDAVKPERATDDQEPKPNFVACPFGCGQFHRFGITAHLQHKHPGAVEPKQDAQPVAGLCDVCRKPEMLHDRCADCTMLLGPHHPAGPIHIHYNDHDYCSSCWAFRAAAPSFGIEIEEKAS